ncbi:autotransporter-associated beta strand repeat-containing protein [Halopseudomonas pelagia]|uniref:autotransporter-associated beta strand repeat-containing protein n=1 Tax=Halopseudomonas pelagia TaxID=553151 RepID=UPI00039B6D64|nr:autotransporter-associated beta strand repeat-containing protein [Halopseudomonas pelagia]|tara:strand:- start:2014 stop:2565 length:552 start_codon:yes stop_codon:yes gene_type:complete
MHRLQLFSKSDSGRDDSAETPAVIEKPAKPAGMGGEFAMAAPEVLSPRAVLYTTSIDSGYPLLDATNGWGRLDLVTAADGYAAFLGDVSVDMDASEGGFHVRDWWRNDISGEGRLTKTGSGQLTLEGDNSYSGGTLVQGGVLEAKSDSAFGEGDLYIEDGSVSVTAEDSYTCKSPIRRSDAAC